MDQPCSQLTEGKMKTHKHACPAMQISQTHPSAIDLHQRMNQAAKTQMASKLRTHRNTPTQQHRFIHDVQM
jgi:hypothetical protein